MDVKRSYMKLFFCLLALCALQGTSAVIATARGNNKLYDFGIFTVISIHIVADTLVKRWKKSSHYLVECSIDQLSKYCTMETAVNFECFRTIGDCIPQTIRDALLDNTEEEEEDDEDDKAPPEDL
ncbi:hypothetical protein BgAZ_203900 [Babesia gibsoni]|uniref:Uncharacterized protein n=1 Tax=Babesia gibsoni TaxID=33632 RepID=A0AAD8LMD9_BABGI|nr:hypothetical protein BgAZ_203900 [Babesia gibsoni]